jgi:hypothetical protein
VESTIIGALDEHGGSDHEEEMFEAIRSKTPADLVELNVRLLAKTAKAFDGMRPV